MSWGYAGRMAPAQRVVVDRVRGFAQITVSATAVASLLHRQPRTRAWRNVRASDVVREVAAEHGYAGELVDVEETKPRLDTINQAAETDAALLQRLAARSGCRFWIDGAGLHWRPVGRGAPPVRAFTWMRDGGDVLDITSDSDLVAATGRVEVTSRDPSTRVEVRAAATAANVERDTLGEVVEVVDPETGGTSMQRRAASREVVTLPAATQEEVDEAAATAFLARERAAAKLTIVVVGDPTLTPGAIVELRGVPKRLGGLYAVEATTHSLSGSGYTTELHLQRDAHRQGASDSREGARQAGVPNVQSTPADPDALVPFELVDPETGATRTTYRLAPSAPAAPAPRLQDDWLPSDPDEP